jgi:Delta7-sterol 5-desaturase
MREVVQYSAPATLLAWVTVFFVGLTLVSTALGYAAERVFAHKRIWAVPLDPGQTRSELIGNAVFLGVTIASFTAVLAARAVRFGEDSGLAITLTFVALALGFQVFYYFLHRAMHHPRLVRFHRWHHRSRVTTPLSGQSMSATEALAWMLGYVGLPLVFSRIVPISVEGWALYMAFNVFGNIVGHANVDPVPVLKGLRATSLLSNVFTYHALHHARWNGHYSFAAALMDRLCGTEWPDWQELHARVAAGEALPSLKEKGESYVA